MGSSNFQNDKNKTLAKDKSLILICIILTQMVLVLASASWTKWYNLFYEFYPVDDTVNYLLGIITVPIGLLGIFLIREIVRLAKRDIDANVAETRLEESKTLVNVLRAQRHDFLNHIQVIFGLIQLGRTEHVKNYITEITGEMESAGRVMSLACPEVSALLMKKSAEAYRKGIVFEAEAHTDLVGIDTPGRELVSIVGNIIDNAFEAVKEQEEKDIRVVMYEKKGQYIIKISNNGPPIPEDVREKIFDEGFSTKGKEGHGYGLALVRQQVQKNRGNITFISDEVETTFIIELMKIPSGAMREVAVSGNICS